MDTDEAAEAGVWVPEADVEKVPEDAAMKQADAALAAVVSKPIEAAGQELAGESEVRGARESRMRNEQ